MAECPSAALADTSLPPMARVLLAVMWSLCPGDLPSGPEDVSLPLFILAARTGMTERSVHRNMRALRDVGWVVDRPDGERGHRLRSELPRKPRSQGVQSLPDLLREVASRLEEQDNG